MSFAAHPTLTFNSLLWLLLTIYGGYVLYDIKHKMKFGIDLVGGTYLTLEVKIDEAIKNDIMTPVQALIDQLKEQKMAEPISAPKVDGKTATGTLSFESDLEATKALTLWQDKKMSNIVNIKQSGKDLIFSISATDIERLREEAIQADIAILRTRLDPFGAGEIPIFPQGASNIAVELPNVSDPEQAKARIGKAALLEMKPVLDYAVSKEELLKKHNNKIPDGTEILLDSNDKIAYLVPNFAKFTGKLLKNSEYVFNPGQGFSGMGKSPHTVSLEFKPAGVEAFHNLTKEALDTKLDASSRGQVAIIIDNVVISAPAVDEPLYTAQASIAGTFTEEGAKDLVALLKSGAFSAPVEVVEERHIGPSLGQESVHKGLLSCLIGLALLFIFSLIFYRTAGLFAFIVLLYNLLLIGLGLIWLDGTLTLPGIAGMVLTIGMAIDSSILIYERIKEELATGASLKTSINAGFAGATGVILDANITTFIVGLVLYYLGSPAIQGFALTMMIGIASTLLTGLVMLKWLFNFFIDGLGVKKISF